METVYVYDGSFEGLLTAVFDTYVRKEEPVLISESNNFQLLLDTLVYNVVTDDEKAERVINKVTEVVGKYGTLTIYRAFLSKEQGRAKAILYYIRLLMKMGKEAERFLGNEHVMNVMEMARKTGNEAHLLKGFLRFGSLSDGTFYAEFSPKTDCIIFLAEHFKRRLSGVPFIINDLTNKKAALCKDGKLDIFPYESFEKPQYDASEKDFKKMWKDFYDTVAVEGRENERCRMTHMPKRFWKHIIEVSGEV